MCCLTNFKVKTTFYEVGALKVGNTSGINYMCSDVYAYISYKSIPDLHGSRLSMLGGGITVTQDYGMTSLFRDD
jgi:hypothetical protein